MASDLLVPAAIAFGAWLLRDREAPRAAPPTARRAEPPTTPPIVPAERSTPATDVPWPRITDVSPIDPSTDHPRDVPGPMERGLPAARGAVDRAVKAARAKADAGRAWIPARRVTGEQRARAEAILRGAEGPWSEGRRITEGDVQYRMARHGAKMGVEVWVPRGG